MVKSSPIGARSFSQSSQADTWEEIWEAGPYYQQLSEALEDAQKFAIFVGWQIDSRLPLKHPRGGQETLMQKILRICESKPDFHFYFLIWDHAYLYVLERETWQGRIWEEVHPRVHFIFDNRHPFGGSHHEKICILDGTIAFSGGIDICGDRWDSREHLYSDPRRSLSGNKERHGPYHDLAIRVTGPICHLIMEHVAERWHMISSTPFPSCAPPATQSSRHEAHLVYLSRTRADVDSGSGGTPIVREIEFLFRDLIRTARKRIILEGQYYWSHEINDLLIAKLHEMKGQDFKLILILADLQHTKSLTRTMTHYEMTLLQQLEATAYETRTQLTLGTPQTLPSTEAQGEKPKPIYIHSKLLIIDDRYLSIGSANFASRALRIDTELSLTLEARSLSERAHIQAVGDQVLAHWKAPGIRLRPIQPRIELLHQSRKPWIRRPLSTFLPLQLFFDPEVPWPYRFKRQFRKLTRGHTPATTLLLLLVSLVGSSIALILSARRLPLFFIGPWPAFYSILLSSAWLLPIPFLPIAILASLHLGVEQAVYLTITSLWVASFEGYALARMFPTWTARFYRRIGPHWLPERIGRRNFQSLISILWDPRIEFRSKIAYQGLYCVPLPWFFLGNWAILPAAVYLSCRAAVFLTPSEIASFIRQHPASFLTALLALSTVRSVRRVLKEGEARSDAIQEAA